MIHPLRQKLHSDSGASLIIALIFFLLALIVGGVMLTSASANAGRLSHLEEEQQAYLTTSSAARLLREVLDGYECVVDGPSGGANPTFTPNHNDGLGQCLSEMVRTLINDDNSQAIARANLTMSASGELMDKMGSVNVELTMDKNYTLTAVLCLPGPTEATNYYLTLTVLASSSQEVYYPEIDPEAPPLDPNVQIQYTKTTINWSLGTISSGRGGN